MTRSAASAVTVAVVGGGVNGLAAARALALRGARVTLFEQFRIGHSRGSSHGAARITRTSYHDPHYARFAADAMAEDWPALERDAGEPLLTPTPGLFFGPRGGSVDAYVLAAAAAGSPVDEVGVPEARRMFPQFRFGEDPRILVDRSAGVLAADAAVAALARLAAAAGAEIREEWPVSSIAADVGGVVVASPRGDARADRVVVAAGAWIGRLVPELAPSFAVARQTVVYAEPSGDRDAWRVPRFPVWVWTGRDEHEHFYGLPEHRHAGIKAARHATGPGSDDPDDPAPPDSPAPPHGPAPLNDGRAVAEVMEFLGRELASPPARVLATERCLYTNTRTQDFALGALPGDPRIVIGAACSGHAFKFAPRTGRVLADFALDGRSAAWPRAALLPE
ncbi:MAG: Monomeric sarcosine oxidase [Planctomycetes bacterium]|nr:Monomeric sarcosine oxidase [Planctomycetota bacterium]